MFSIACTSSSTCITVGAGGRERRTTDGGNTWTDVATAPGNNKPLTQVTCPSSSICYAVGDRGNVMKSTDGGQTWAWLSTHGRQPDLRALVPDDVGLLRDRHLRARPQDDRRRRDLDVADDADHDAGRDQVAETGGPNPFAGLTGDLVLRRDHVRRRRHLRVGQRPDDPEHRSADRHHDRRRPTWTRQTSGAGTGNYLHAVSCLPGHDDVLGGRPRRAIVTTTDLDHLDAADVEHDEPAEQRATA